jgi:phosphohistidine phosphatase
MRLYVMRHGPAEDRAATGRDFDRVLTVPGRSMVTRAARALCEARRPLGPRPWRVLASPFRRARETAEIVVATASASLMDADARPADPQPPGALDVELDEDLSAGAGLPLDLVRRLAADGTDALLVGHQPTVEELARELVHPARMPLPGGFRTATILTFERIAPDRWHPAAVLDPRRLDP